MKSTKTQKRRRLRRVRSIRLLAGVELIAAERQRQISKEGYTSAHDDTHTAGEIGEAAECYIAQARQRHWLPLSKYRADGAPHNWPWEEEWWHPSSPVRDLVKAGALIAAEIDRLQRVKPANARTEARGDERVPNPKTL